MRKIAIINPLGFDGGGATTLCLQYAKLGIDVWFKNCVYPNQYIPEITDTIHTWSHLNELMDAVKEYDRIFFINLWFGSKRSLTNTINDIKTIKHFRNQEICFIHCSRQIDDLKRLLTECEDQNFIFDHVYSINPLSTTLGYDYVTSLNINAVVLSDDYDAIICAEDRTNIVFSAGRVESFKGTLRYFSSIDDSFIKSTGKYSYIHEGAKFSKHESNNGVSCPPQLLPLFDLTQRPKVLKPQFSFKQYGEAADPSKFNIYPSYKLSDIKDRWKYYYAGVCCILGTKSHYSLSGGLFTNVKSVISDVRERNLIEMAALNWNNALEYADIEKIMFGVPTLFSHKYAEIINFSDSRLIYDCFLDIPKKVALLQNYYDDARQSQYSWLMEQLKETNSTIIERFTGDNYEK